MPNVTEVAKRRGRLSDGLMVAALPAASYGLTFAYQAGYSGYFGYPVALSALSLKTVFLFAVGLAGILPILWNALRAIYLFRPPLEERAEKRAEPQDGFKQALGRRLVVPLVVTSLFFPVAVMFGWRWETGLAALLLGGYVIVYSFFVLLLPLLSDRGKSYRDKITETELGEREDPGLDLLALNALERWMGAAGVFLVLITLVLAGFSYLLGRSVALNRESFFVLTETPSLAVLEFEDEKLITAELDRECGGLTGKFVVVPFDASVGLRREEVGPILLKPCEGKKSP